MFNVKMFKAVLLMRNKSIKDVAECLNISVPTVYRKMNGESDWFREEINKVCILLNLSDVELNEIFFAHKIA